MTQINQIKRRKRQEMNAALLIKSYVEILFENSVSSSVNPAFLCSLSAKYINPQHLLWFCNRLQQNLPSFEMAPEFFLLPWVQLWGRRQVLLVVFVIRFLMNDITLIVHASSQCNWRCIVCSSLLFICFKITRLLTTDHCDTVDWLTLLTISKGPSVEFSSILNHALLRGRPYLK